MDKYLWPKNWLFVEKIKRNVTACFSVYATLIQRILSEIFWRNAWSGFQRAACDISFRKSPVILKIVPTLFVKKILKDFSCIQLGLALGKPTKDRAENYGEVFCSVGDPWHFGTEPDADPDPREAKKHKIRIWIRMRIRNNDTFTSFFNDKKS